MARISSLLSVLVLFLSGRTYGQLQGEPTCATPCLQTAIPAGGCTPGDLDCLCGPSFAPILAILGPCLVLKCGAGDINSMSSLASARCSTAAANALAAVFPTATSTASTTSTSISTTTTAAAGATSNSSTASSTSTSTGTSTLSEPDPPFPQATESPYRAEATIPSTTLLTTTSSTSSSTSTSAAENVADGKDGIDGGQVDTGISAGIAVGTGAGTFSLLSLGVFVLLHRSGWGKAVIESQRASKRNKAKNRTQQREWPDVEYRKRRFTAVHINKDKGTEFELETPERVFELPGSLMKHELP